MADKGRRGKTGESWAKPWRKQALQLAESTHFTLNEVEALRELFELVSTEEHTHHEPGCFACWLSNAPRHVRVLHREAFMEALFGQRDAFPHLFGDRVFALFDHSNEGSITFPEFVHSLSVFHPSASSEEKQAFAFQLYDLDGTGSIERREVKDMLLALMRDNPNLSLPESALERIIDKTFEEVDLCGDGKIHFNEWKQLVLRNPNVINNMTLDVLRDVTARYSGFILSSTATHSTPWLSQLQAFSYMPIAR